MANDRNSITGFDKVQFTVDNHGASVKPTAGQAPNCLEPSAASGLAIDFSHENIKLTKNAVFCRLL